MTAPNGAFAPETHEQPAPARPTGEAFSVRSSPRLLLLAVLAGVYFRLLQYLPGRSLWLDEARLALEIGRGSLLDSFLPSQASASPPGFLLLERAATALLGGGEHALRLVPLLAGIGALLLFARVIRRVLEPAAATVAVALFAISPYLIYFSSELKHYSLDVLVAVALLAAALRVRPERWTAALAAAWALTGFVAIFFSYTGALVFAGLTAALLLLHLHEGRQREAAHLAAAGGIWAGALLTAYLFLARGIGREEQVGAFWQGGFMPFPPRTAGDLMWLPESVFRLFRDPLGLLDLNALQTLVAVSGLAAFAAGVWQLARQAPALLTLLLAPVVGALAAGVLGLYPFGSSNALGGRVLLFLVPFLIALIAVGVGQLLTAGATPRRAGGLVLLAALLVPPAAEAVMILPFGRAEVKPLLRVVEDEWLPGDVLYVHYDAATAFRYYQPRLSLPGGEVVVGACHRLRPEGYLETVVGFAGEPRVWVLFGEGTGAERFDERSFVLGFLEHLGERRDQRFTTGASLHLYDLSGAGLAPYPARRPHLRYGVEEDCIWQ